MERVGLLAYSLGTQLVEEVGIAQDLVRKPTEAPGEGRQAGRTNLAKRGCGSCVSPSHGTGVPCAPVWARVPRVAVVFHLASLLLSGCPPRGPPFLLSQPYVVLRLGPFRVLAMEGR